MKNDVTDYDRAIVKEEQDRRAPITPAAHELTPAQLELVAGGGDRQGNCPFSTSPLNCYLFVKR
jgi:hypothetical protein